MCLALHILHTHDGAFPFRYRGEDIARAQRVQGSSSDSAGVGELVVCEEPRITVPAAPLGGAECFVPQLLTGYHEWLGRNQNFCSFIGSLTARERELFRFPAAGHPIYTREHLALMEGQYPGWNARGEYLPGEEIEALDDPHLFGVGYLPDELK